MHPPKNMVIRKNTIRPPFMPTSVRMMRSHGSKPPASRENTLPARHVSVVSVPDALSGLSVTPAAARRVAGSVMTSVRRVGPVRTSPNV